MNFILNAADFKIKQATEVEEEFFFLEVTDLNRLLCLIRFILDYKAWKRPKDERQALLEYKRRGYLFIM